MSGEERSKNMKVLDNLLGKETAVLDVQKATNSFIANEQKQSSQKKSFKGGKGGKGGAKGGRGGKAGGRKGK